MMPLLFSSGRRAAFESVQMSLRVGASLLAFVDDVYTVSTPERSCDIHRLLEESLWVEPGIRVHEGKTQVWNATGESPPGCVRLQRAAVLADPAAVVWPGSAALPSHRRGIKVLGTPLGHQDFVCAQLEMISAHHHTLLARIPMVVVSSGSLRIRSGDLCGQSVGAPGGRGVLSGTGRWGVAVPLQNSPDISRAKGRCGRSCFHAFGSGRCRVAISLSSELPSVLGELGNTLPVIAKRHPQVAT